MPRTVLLLLFGDLGDIILAVPAIRAIRRRDPSASLLLVGKSAAGTYLEGLGLIDTFIEVDKHSYDRVWSLVRPRAVWSLIKLVRVLRRANPETAILFHHLVTPWGALKFASLTLASGARRRLGLDNGRGWFLTDSVVDRGFGERHEAEYWLDVAGLLGATGDLHLEAPISNSEREYAEIVLGPFTARGLSCVAIHPGTGWYGPGRRWPARRFAETTAVLQQRAAMCCVIVGSGQDELAAVEVERRLSGAVVNLVNRTTTGQLSAILQKCSLLIANDGGVAHLASAVGTPVVAVFGPSNDRAWRPLTATVIAADLPCRPCFYRDHERGLASGCATRECLALVTPETVAAAAERILQDIAIAG